jgi:hypothetical protein
MSDFRNLSGLGRRAAKIHGHAWTTLTINFLNGTVNRVQTFQYSHSGHEASRLACSGVIIIRDLTAAFGIPGITLTKSITNSELEWVITAKIRIGTLGNFLLKLNVYLILLFGFI